MNRASGPPPVRPPLRRRAAPRSTIPLTAALLCSCAASPREQTSSAPIRLDRVPIVYGIARRVHDSFRVTDEQWEQIAALFDGVGDDPSAERRAISLAVGRIESIAGEQNRTRLDLAMDNRGDDGRGGVLDCIDESTNTSTYLALLKQRGLIRLHDVMAPVWRSRFWISRHRTALIRDRADGALYAVDSWFFDNGVPAVIQTLERWRAKTKPQRPEPGKTPAPAASAAR